MKPETIRAVAETVADCLLKAEQEIQVDIERKTDLWWAEFLEAEGCAHLWRKGVVTRGMLLEGKCIT